MTLAMVIGIGAVGALVALLVAAVGRTRRTAHREWALPSGPMLRLPRGRSTAAAPRPAARAPVSPRSLVSVVIPTLNEEGSLPWVLQNLPSWVDEVVLVDGLSTDATQVLARRIRPDAVVVHQFQRGKGAALRAGFAAASGDIIVMIDADGSTDPREMDSFVDALRDGADFVKGSRYASGGGSVDITWMRSAGNRALVLLANAFYGSRFTDLCYGYCAFWRRHLETLGLTADGFEIETELVLSALAAQLEIREVPSFELERLAGVSNLNAFRDGLRVLRTMLGRGDRRHPSEVHFSLHPFHLPVWRSDFLPGGVDRRRVDRRMRDRTASGYTGPERRSSERRATVGNVVAYRAVYDRPPAERRL
jgi:glycosyltransferase involved in cell wall biosynthesis